MNIEQEAFNEEMTINALRSSKDKSFAFLFSFSKPYRVKLFFSLALLVTASIAVVGSARALGILVDRGIKDPLSADAPQPDLSVAIKWSAIIIIFELFAVVSNYIGRRGLATAAIFTLKDIRKKLFSHLQELPMSFFDKQPLGRTVTRLTHDVEGIEEFFSGVLARLLSAGISLSTVIVAMIITNPRLGVIMFLAITPAVLLTLLLRNTVRGYNRDMAHRNSAINARLWEFLNAIPVIRGFGAELWSQRTYDEVVHKHLSSSIRLNVLNAWSRPLILILCQLPLFWLLWIGGHDVIAGTMELGLFVTFIRYCERFSRPVSALAQEIHVVQTAWVSAERVTNFLNRPTEETVFRNQGNFIPPQLRGEIEFKRVGMKYDVNAEKNILSQLSFHVPAGSRIGLAGKTGSGKTTTLGLLARLYEFQSGEILIDGVSIRDFHLQALRSQIGYVSQDVVIFKGTLRENLSMGKELSHEEIEEACAATGLTSVLLSRGLSLESEILDQGANLSFGERQLIALTRVLISKPAILILDEATANIDPKTEQTIVRAIKSVMTGRTTFLIAHRLATLKDCDRILVFKDGRLVEEGSYVELEKKGGYYSELVESGEKIYEHQLPDT